MPEYRVVAIEGDGTVASSFGKLTDREFAERIAGYACKRYPHDVIELQMRAVPRPPPTWQTVRTYQPEADDA